MLAFQTHQEALRIHDQRHQKEATDHILDHPHLAVSQEHLTDDLRQAVQDGIDSGPAIPSDQMFAELNARYASHHA